jgi:hypothetical protein
LTNSDIKIMIAKDVASQQTKLALHTIRTNVKETKGGQGCLTEMSLTQPETKTNTETEGKLKGEGWDLEAAEILTKQQAAEIWEKVKQQPPTRSRQKIRVLSTALREINKRVQENKHHTYYMSYEGQQPAKKELQNITVKTYGSVNGAPSIVIWDTGSTSTMVSASMARRCHLTPMEDGIRHHIRVASGATVHSGTITEGRRRNKDGVDIQSHTRPTGAGAT